MGARQNDQTPLLLLSDQERMQLLEANVTDYAIFLIDTRQRVASWNAGAERILGYREAEILGEPAAQLFTPEDREQGAHSEEFRLARQTGRAEDERWHLRKDGSRFWGLGIMTALYDEAGELRGYAKILRDFTERKQHEDRIESLNARLQRAMTETHHRVKNNLQIVSAMIDFQTLGRDEAVPVAEYRRLSGQVRALAAVHEILTEDTKLGGTASFVSLQALLEKLLTLMQSTTGLSRITHRLADAHVSAQQGSSVALIVNELVNNAVKYGCGEVHVELTCTDGRLALQVYDNGLGFPAGFTVQPGVHTGLGLVESLTMLDLHGEIDYAAAPSGGGCVCIFFLSDG